MEIWPIREGGKVVGVCIIRMYVYKKIKVSWERQEREGSVSVLNNLSGLWGVFQRGKQGAMGREEARRLHMRPHPWSGSVKPSPVALLDSRDGPRTLPPAVPVCLLLAVLPWALRALGIAVCVSAGVLRRSGKGKWQVVMENAFMASLESSSWPVPVQLSITGSAENARQGSENRGVQKSPVVMEFLVWEQNNYVTRGVERLFLPWILFKLKLWGLSVTWIITTFGAQVRDILQNEVSPVVPCSQWECSVHALDF